MREGDDDGTELSRALRAARRDAGLRQADVVVRTPISQAQLSRIESAGSIPTSDQAAALAQLYGLDEAEVSRLVSLAREERAGIRDERLVVQRGSTLAMQRRWRHIEGKARVVRAFHPAVVLGVLQTSAYAAVATRQPADSKVVHERMRRHERLLVEQHRQHLLIQAEGALRQVVGSHDVMVEQIDRILDVAAAPNVELAMVPARHPLHLLVGSGFHIYDDVAVVVGLEIAAATLTDAGDVRHFRSLWDRLWAASMRGDDALVLIRSIKEEMTLPTS